MSARFSIISTSNRGTMPHRETPPNLIQISFPRRFDTRFDFYDLTMDLPGNDRLSYCQISIAAKVGVAIESGEWDCGLLWLKMKVLERHWTRIS